MMDDDAQTSSDAPETSSEESQGSTRADANAALASDESKAEVIATNPEVLADSLGDYLRAWVTRIRSGESGALPIIVGLIIIVIFFQLERSQFDSAQNLVNLLIQASIYVMLGAALVFSLILSEIDLSVGWVLAVGGFIMAECNAPPVNFPWWLAILAGLVASAAIGYVQGAIITWLRVPSFVVTLAGLLIWEGVTIELANVDSHAVGGVISVSQTSVIYKLVSSNMSVALSWIVLIVVLALYAFLTLARVARRRSQGLSAPPLSVTLLGIGLTAIGGIVLVYICTLNRGLLIQLKGVPWVVPFIGIVLLIYSIFLGRTRTGRYMYAIGANPEAARRAGVNVQRVRRIAFMLSGLTAGIGGLVYTSWLGSISTDVPGGNYTLYGVAAAVIGGASLFGGRGKPVHALLGALVIAAVFNGLALMGINAAGEYIATGVVLVVAATVDATLRRSGTA
jgi:D-xylose transport system permease protein